MDGWLPGLQPGLYKHFCSVSRDDILLEMTFCTENLS